MNILKNVLLVGALLAAHLTAQWSAAQEEKTTAAEQAQAVFAKRCVRCHSQSQARGGLDMSSLESIRAGSNSGVVVEPGKPHESLVYTLAAHEETPAMPPNAPRIAARELKAISAWIESLKPVEDDPTPSASSSASPSPAPKMRAGASEASPKLNSVVDGLVPVQPLAGPMAITALAGAGKLVAVSGYRQVLLMDIEQAKWIGALDFPEGDVFALKFIGDGQRLVAAGGLSAVSGGVVCWDMQTHRRVSEAAIEDDIVLAMDVSPDGKLVAVGGPNRAVEMIDLSSGTSRKVLRKHADWVTCVSFSHDGALLASADRFGSIYLWDVQGGVQFDTCASHTGAVTSLQWTGDSNQLWSVGKDGLVQNWDLEQRTSDRRWLVSEQGICSLEITDNQLFTLDNQRRLIAYDHQGKQQHLIQLRQEPTRSAWLGSSSERMVLGDFEGQLNILDPRIDSHVERNIASYPLPKQALTLQVSYFAPRSVERKLRPVQVAEKGPHSGADPGESEARQSAARQLDRQATLELARQTLSSSRVALEQARQNLSELEDRIQQMQRLVHQLESPGDNN